MGLCLELPLYGPLTSGEAQVFFSPLIYIRSSNVPTALHQKKCVVLKYQTFNRRRKMITVRRRVDSRGLHSLDAYLKEGWFVVISKKIIIHFEQLSNGGCKKVEELCRGGRRWEWTGEASSSDACWNHCAGGWRLAGRTGLRKTMVFLPNLLIPLSMVSVIPVSQNFLAFLLQWLQIERSCWRKRSLPADGSETSSNRGYLGQKDKAQPWRVAPFDELWGLQNSIYSICCYSGEFFLLFIFVFKIHPLHVVQLNCKLHLAETFFSRDKIHPLHDVY